MDGKRRIKMIPFKTALNASTLFPFKLNVIEQIRVTAEAGYDGIELWMRDIETYLEAGGTVDELTGELRQNNIEFVNSIAFFKWADRDAVTREMAMKQAEQEMLLLHSLGCKMIAAPPFGDVESVKSVEITNYFKQLFIMGHEIGVEPVLEFWGKAKNLNTLSDAFKIIQKSNMENAKILLDPFHMYVGGSEFLEIKKLTGNQIGIFHVNDYPGNPERGQLEDSHRVFPGEGISPTNEIAQMLSKINYSGYLSLELFKYTYGNMLALDVAKHGLQALKRTYSINRNYLTNV